MRNAKKVLGQLNTLTLGKYYRAPPFTIQAKNEESKSTENTEEVSKFRNWVNFWWDETGELKPLHAMNNLRVPFVRDGLKTRGKLHKEFEDSATPLKNLNILDIGCGGGILTEPLARLGAKVTGVDACAELIECAKLHADNGPDIKDSLTYIHSLLEDISSEYKDSFDAVVSSETIEHVASKELFLKSCVEVLKPGGSLFLTTENRTILSWLGVIVAGEYILNILPKGTHDWNNFIPPHEMQKILEINGCQTKMVQGMFYNVVSNSWSWIPNTAVNYALHAIKL